MNEENKNFDSAAENEADQTTSEADNSADQGADQSGSEGQKTFTQADVDRIVKERLKRFKAKAQEEQSADLTQRLADLDKRESDLKSRETKLQCKEYLSEKGYSAELMDILDTTDFDKFKSKAEKVMQLNSSGGSSPRRKTAPLFGESANNYGSDSGSFKEVKHTPKKLY